MATEAALRQRVRVLTRLGVTQKAIAAAMGVSDSWLTRWLKEVEGYRVRVEEMDRFTVFAETLAVAALGLDPRDGLAIEIVRKIKDAELERSTQPPSAQRPPSDPSEARGTSAKSQRR